MKKALTITGIIVAVILVGLLLLLTIVEINKPKPPKAITEDVSVAVPLSTFNVPVRFKLEKLENYLNTIITGTFLQKSIFLQSSKKEEVYLTLTKEEALSVTSDGKKLFCTLPLTVNARLVRSRFGNLLTRLFKPLQTSLLITVSTPVSLDKRWNVSTHFMITGYQWIKEPVLRFGPFRKTITKHLDIEIQNKSRVLMEILDKEINRKVSLRPTVSGVWKSLQKPIAIHKNPPKAWIRFICEDIKGSIKLSRREIICNTLLKAHALVVTDTTAEKAPLPLPEFSRLPEKDTAQQSDIYLYAFTTFSEINEQLNDYFKGKTFTEEGRSLIINSIGAYASEQGITIAVETNEIFKGKLYISGQLAFDVPSQKLQVHNFDYALDSKSALIQTGDDLLHTSIKNAIASRLHLNLETEIAKVPALVHNAISKGKAGKTINLAVKDIQIRSCDILMGKDKIHLIINVSTDAEIELKRIKPGKRITITKALPLTPAAAGPEKS